MKRPDIVELNHFRQAPDGTTVFFPWRPVGRGYILPDEKAKRSALRITRALYASIFVAASLAYAVVRHGVPIRETGFADFVHIIVLALVYMVGLTAWGYRSLLPLWIVLGTALLTAVLGITTVKKEPEVPEGDAGEGPEGEVA